MFSWDLSFRNIFFEVLVFVFVSFIVDLFVLVNHIRVHLFWYLSLGVLNCFCGVYPNWTYGFASPTCLWKFGVRSLVECSYFFASIDCFSWYKTTFKFFIQALRGWLLTCVYWFFVSAFIYHETCPRVCYKIICCTYPNKKLAHSSRWMS